MINKDSRISLSYSLVGESLVRLGRYIAADIYVTNSFTKKETFKIIKPMRTLNAAVYSKATIQTTLGSSFVEAALKKPEKPKGKSANRWFKEPIGKASLGWRKLSSEQKVEAHVKQYVSDMGGEEYSFEII